MHFSNHQQPFHDSITNLLHDQFILNFVPAPSENMNHVPDLAHAHTNQPIEHILSLQGIRPIPGIWMGEDPVANGAYDASAWDVLLALLRLLKSYGYEPPTTLIAAEVAVLNAAGKVLGFDQETDWHIKRHLQDLLGQPPSLEDLLDQLPNLLLRNSQFRMFKDEYYLRVEDKWYSRKTEVAHAMMRPDGHLILCDNQGDLGAQLWSNSGSDEHRFLGEALPFLLIKYEVKDHEQDTKDIFQVTRRIIVSPGRQNAIQLPWYQLCSILVPARDGKGNQMIVLDQDGEQVPWANVKQTGQKVHTSISLEWKPILGLGVHFLVYFQVVKGVDPAEGVEGQGGNS